MLKERGDVIKMRWVIMEGLGGAGVKRAKKLVFAALGVLVVVVVFFGGRWYEQIRKGSGGVPAEAAAATVTPAAPALARQDTRVRIVFVGLDALDWQVADPLIEAGRMPSLAKMKKQGVWGRLRTITPPLSPVLWTSIGTGREPVDHGILDFLATDMQGKSVPVSSNFRKVPALWNLATAAGLKVGVVGWWATWPAEEVNGYVVTDKLAYQLFGLGASSDGPIEKGMVYPSALGETIRPLVVNKQDVSMETVRRFLDIPPGWETSGEATDDDRERVDLFRGYIAQGESYRRIGLELHRRHSPDIDLVYFEPPDEVSHVFMCFRRPPMPGVDAKRIAWFGHAVDRYYEECDRILGDFVKLAEADGAAVMVVSDHGFKNGADRPSTDSRIGKGGAADWHRKYGVIACAGGPFAKGGREIQEASILDVAPTLLAAVGIPVSREMAGRVLEEAFDPDFLKRNPVRNMASYDLSKRPTDGAPASSETDRQQLEALAALGYIDPGAASPASSGQDAAAGIGGQTLDGPNFHNNRGTVLMREGKLDEAIAEFKTAIGTGGGFPMAQLNLARTYRLKGDYAAARRTLEPLLTSGGDIAAPANNEMGRLEMELKNNAQAEAYFRRALELSPNAQESMTTLAELLEKTGRIDDAIALNKKCIETDPDDEQGYNNIGNIYRRLGNPKEAEAWYRKAIRADSDFAGSYNNLGIVLQEQGRLKEAEDQYLVCLKKSQETKDVSRHDYAVVLNSLGTLYYNRSQTDPSYLAKAKAKFQEALQADPKYPEAHNNLGAVLGREGRSEEALREYETAVTLEPRYPDGLTNLGRTYLRLGDPDKAIDPLKRAVELVPGSAPTHLLLANAYAMKGRHADALASADRALAIDPGFVPAIVQKERSLTQLNRLNDAVLVIEGALTSFPNHRVLLTDLQQLYTRLSRTADAERIKARIAALGPS